MAAMLSLVLKPVAYLSLPILALHQISAKSTIARYYIRLALYFSTLSACSLWGVILSIFMTLAGRRFDINFVVARSFHLLAGQALGISFDVEGEEHLDNSRPAVIVGNHQSMLDILYVGRIMPRGCTMLAKRELIWTPLLGQFMLLSGAVFVDRMNNQDAVRSLANAGQTMKEQHTSIWLFPEGTRTSQEQCNMLPFKKGAFHLAVQAGIPVVPVVCENYWRLYRNGVFEGGRLRLRVLPPISTAGLGSEDVVQLADRTRTLMLQALREISGAGSGEGESRKEQDRVSPTPTPREMSPAIGEIKTDSVVDERKESLLGHEGKFGGSETSSVSGEQTEEDEGMILVGRPQGPH